MTRQICDKIDWVGAVDWHIRDFHGYDTGRGSTYNAYLLRDGKTALVDTVKARFAEQMLHGVSGLCDLASIDYIVCNHAEPDHASGLTPVVEACPNARVLCTEKCASTLAGYHDTSGWAIETVGTGDSVSLGELSLSFLETPMVHWPESMMSYCPERKVLFSQDGFGQHYASSGRFDDEEPLDVVMWEAKTYYANIIMWAGRPIAKALDAASGLDIEIIAPAHGVIWRSHPGEIVAAYRDWVECKAQAKVLIVYDSMWESTDMMANAIHEGCIEEGVTSKLFSIRKNNITLLATEVLDAAAIAFGSPTLNGTLMPEMAAGLTYLKGLRPTCKAGLAFGSYGWAAGGAKAVNEYLEDMKFDILREPLNAQWRPDAETLEECRQAGRLLAERARQAACTI